MTRPRPFPPAPEVVVQRDPSLCVLFFCTDDAQDWADRHLRYDPGLMWAGGIPCETRYVADIIDGLERDGFRVAA